MSQSVESSATPAATSGPASKRQKKRATDRRINTAATKVDNALRTHVETLAEEESLSKDDLFQRFSLIAPVGEQRAPMWWNGLIAEKSVEWKDEYRELSTLLKQSSDH
jgi:hypothetical protein